nr:triphosphoribosyl-dephospho-CoA synthase CitG [Paucilactobacillus kaifaensis]
MRKNKLKLANEITENALKALLYEVSVTPKPGLVDPHGHGSHSDMTVFTFIDSSVSLQSYFNQCVQAGLVFGNNDLTQLFETIRPLGIQAEKDMFAVTKGVNTHKGAVFSLGVFTAATGYLLNRTKGEVQANFNNDLVVIIKAMLNDLIDHDFDKIKQKNSMNLTAGEQQFLKYGKTGIRGEAQAGFPIVFNHALPYLKASKGTVNQRLLDTLMTIVSYSDDSNLIKRAGTVDILDWTHRQVERYFELGGSCTDQGLQFLYQLDEVFTKDNLSLGGSADLLILTIFLGLMEKVI